MVDILFCATFSGQQRQSVSNSLMPLSSCQVGVYNIISVPIIIIYKKIIVGYLCILLLLLMLLLRGNIFPVKYFEGYVFPKPYNILTQCLQSDFK